MATTEHATRNPSTAPWQSEAKRFMDENNNRYAAAVAEKRAEKAEAVKELYRSIQKQG